MLLFSTISLISKSFSFSSLWSFGDFWLVGSFLLFLVSRHHVVDSQKHAAAFNRCLVDLSLHCDWLPDVQGGHVHHLPSVPIDTVLESPFLVVLGPQFSDQTDDVSSAVAGEDSWDDFKRSGDGFVGKLLDSLDLIGLFHQPVTDCHFDGSSSWK